MGANTGTTPESPLRVRRHRRQSDPGERSIPENLLDQDGAALALLLGVNPTILRQARALPLTFRDGRSRAYRTGGSRLRTSPAPPTAERRPGWGQAYRYGCCGDAVAKPPPDAKPRAHFCDMQDGTKPVPQNLAPASQPRLEAVVYLSSCQRRWGPRRGNFQRGMVGANFDQTGKVVPANISPVAKAVWGAVDRIGTGDMQS